MIYILVGTKAQFIKMSPILYLLDRREILYRLVDLSQHSSITKDILSQFSIHTETFSPVHFDDSVTSYWKAARWLYAHAKNIILKKISFLQSKKKR